MSPRQPPPSFASLEDARNHIAEPAYQGVAGRRMGDLSVDDWKRIKSDQPKREALRTFVAARILLAAVNGDESVPESDSTPPTRHPQRTQQRPAQASTADPAPNYSAPITVHVTQDLPLMPCGHPIQVVKEHGEKFICLWCRSNATYERRVRQLEAQIRELTEDASGTGAFRTEPDAWCADEINDVLKNGEDTEAVSLPAFGGSASEASPSSPPSSSEGAP